MKKVNWHIISFVFISLMCTKMAFAQGELSQQIHQIMQTATKEGAHVGFYVAALDSGRVIAEGNPDALLNPASNVKLFTAAAALAILGPDYRFKTVYSLRGPLRKGVLEGDLVVKGYGDPGIDEDRLYSVANELALRGIRSIKGNIVLDDTYFDKQEEPNGEDESDHAYAAPTGALAFNRNVTSVFVRPGQKGEAAFASVDPDEGFVVLKGSLSTGCKHPMRLSSVDTPYGTTLDEGGCVSARLAPRRYYRRIFHSTPYFGAALKHHLVQRGISVSGKVLLGTEAGNDQVFLVDRSVPLSQTLQDLNQWSNNFIGEMVLKTLGAQVALPGSFANGLAQVSHFLEDKVGFAKGSYQLGNGSGLNDMNRFSARQVVRLLQYMHSDFSSCYEYVASLAVAGSTGTIAKRLKADGLRKLRGKTGTLKNVCALSGYLTTADKELLVFSILIDGHHSTAHKMRTLQDRVSELLLSYQAVTAQRTVNGRDT